MSFGQLVIGPPGAGKTSYCSAMFDFLEAQGRPVCVVNLDPGNDALPYSSSTRLIDVTDLIGMEEVMDTFQLGPNGGLIYCIEYLEKNATWLKTKIKEQQKQQPDVYFLFDLPGQVELYTHHAGLKRLITRLCDSCDLRLTCVHLIDSHHCSDPSKFLSVLLLALNSMTQLELPHVNVLSKMDLIEQFGPLEFGLDFYTDVMDLHYLLPRIEAAAKSPKAHPLARKMARLHASLAELIESYNLVSFVPLDIKDRELMASLVQLVDKANGAMYVARDNAATGAGASGSTTAGAAAAADGRSSLFQAVDRTQLQEVNLPDIQERYMPRTTQEPPRPRRTAAAGAASGEGGQKLSREEARKKQLREFEEAQAAVLKAREAAPPS